MFKNMSFLTGQRRVVVMTKSRHILVHNLHPTKRHSFNISSNSEAFASEILENPGEISPRLYIYDYIIRVCVHIWERHNYNQGSHDSSIEKLKIVL